jgi:hydrogenase maturation protease
MRNGTNSRKRSDPWRRELSKCILGSAVPVHLVGVGNPIRHDDAAGLELVTTLRRRLHQAGRGRLRIHPASSSPERLLTRLASEGEQVIVFDAVEARREAGAIVCARLGDTKFGYFATHNVPLRLVPGVSEESGRIFLVGIQPGSLEVGEGLSEPVMAALEELSAAIVSIVEGEK